MAIPFSDGCDSYAATADLSKKWGATASPWAFSSNSGRTGGGALQAVGGTGGIALPSFAGILAATKVCVAFWLKMSAVPGSATTFFALRDSGGVMIGNVRLDTSGRIALYSTSSTFVNTGVANVCDGNWHWVEILFDHSVTTGTQKLYVDGMQEWNSSMTLLSKTVDRFEFQSMASRTLTIDDVVVWDDSTGFPQIADIPLGSRQITTKRTSSDVSTGFATVTGGGAHYSQLSESNPDGDTSYVESSGSGQADLYGFAALGITPANITAVVANAYVENPNPGVANFRQNAKSVSTTINGTSIQAPASYRIVMQSFPKDPNTNAAWANAAAIDAASFGIEHV